MKAKVSSKHFKRFTTERGTNPFLRVSGYRQQPEHSETLSFMDEFDLAQCSDKTER